MGGAAFARWPYKRDRIHACFLASGQRQTDRTILGQEIVLLQKTARLRRLSGVEATAGVP